MLVVGDLHLTRHSDDGVIDDFCRLLDENRGERMVIAGDLFDLSTDPEAVQAAPPELRRAMGAFAEHGRLTVLNGNHDAELESLDIDGVTIRPWFMRRGDLHIEHGHLYDPDNTPGHPLIRGEPSLGVHFSAEFIHPTQAHRFLSNNDGTPLDLFLSSFRWYGPRAPYVIYRYFHAAFQALLKSGPLYRAGREHHAGCERHGDFAQDCGVPRTIVDSVLSIRAPSTLESWSDTFARLYLDRVTATLLCGTSLATRNVGLGVLGGMLMVMSWLRGHDRYGGTVVDHLDSAASRIADTTGADYVIFGHTHREALDARYANTGSFGFPRGAPGRPYLRVNDDASVERLYG